MNTRHKGITELEMGQMFLTGALGTLKLCVSSAFLREQHLDSVYREIYFCLHGQEEGRSISEDLKGSCSHRPLSSLGRIQKLQGMKCLGAVERLLICGAGDPDWVRASVSQDNCGDRPGAVAARGHLLSL